MKVIDMFNEYKEHHIVSIGTDANGDIYFCGNQNCIQCILLDKCTGNSTIPVLSDKELKLVQLKYPEHFL